MVDTDVLIAGAGPIGLTAAIELARRGVDIRIVDPIHDPPLYAKAVGVPDAGFHHALANLVEPPAD